MPALSSPPAPAPAPSVSTPADARRLAAGMIEVMSALLAIVEQETELVRAGKVREAMDLEPRKSEASRQYVQALTELGNSRDYLTRSTPELLTTLHRHHDTFRAMLQVNLTVTISESPQVSQPAPFSQGRTVVTPNTRVGVTEDGKKLALVKDGVSLQQLVDGLNGLGIGPRDLIGILQAIKAAGAIQADIEVM